MVELKNKLYILKKEDYNFPWRLRILKDCPDILFVLGNPEILNNFSIAVVGSRICSEYGKRMAEKFSTELVSAGVCIVSGLAEGIDAYAHNATLKQAGKTIAILGGGFANIFPKCNEKLLNDIIERGGAIISEYFPDDVPKSFYFPRRNRLVACMTEGTLVVEAREKSGALITASIAKKYNKKVFVVPSNLDNEKSKGSNGIIKLGAKVTFFTKDILDEFSYYNFKPHNIVQEPVEVNVPNEFQSTYMLLKNEPQHLNEICRVSEKNIEQTMAELTMLEMYGYIKQLPGKLYKK